LAAKHRHTTGGLAAAACLLLCLMNRRGVPVPPTTTQDRSKHAGHFACWLARITRAPLCASQNSKSSLERACLLSIEIAVYEIVCGQEIMRAQNSPREMQPLSPNIASPQTSLAGNLEEMIAACWCLWAVSYTVGSCSFVCSTAGDSFHMPWFWDLKESGDSFRIKYPCLDSKHHAKLGRWSKVEVKF
jgi:hypothetical protein